jgi:tetratricopeptide (TPR) repeat protein
MSRIFVSHSAKDGFPTVAIGEWLKEEGWDDVYLDVDPDRGTQAGERWQRALYDHASDCEAVLFLVSRNWLTSEWCRREYDLARKLNKHVFVVLIDDMTVSDLPASLKETHQAVSLAAGEDHRVFRVTLPVTHEQGHVTFSREGLTRLKNGLVRAGLDPRFFAWPPANEPNRAPYRGFDPVDEVDAGIFFGREAPIIDVLDLLRGLREGANPRLLALLGASGAGKSSFLRAGVLPRLARDDRNFLVLPIVRPERAVLSGGNGLIAALVSAAGKRGLAITRSQVREAVKQGGEKTREIFRALIGNRVVDEDKPPTLVVAVDQAEELFCPEGVEGEPFLALLRDFVSQDDPALAILFSIRTDSYDALERAKPLQGLRQYTYPLLPMPRGAYQTVIESPAKRLAQAGRKFEIDPGLTQALLTELEQGEGSDALPLLAFTLEQLYHEHAAAGKITREDLDRFEGLKGAIDAAVTRVFVEADKDSRIPAGHEARLTLLRHGLIPWLAGVDPESKSARRHIARAAQIPSEARPLIDLLVEQRLLTRDKDKGTGEATIEPTHEALLRQWGLLAGWLSEDFGLLTTLEAVKRAARDWDANGRAEAWLSHQGPRLAGAQMLDTRADIAGRLDASDRAYLAACLTKEESARAKEEAHRQAREEEQARRLHDARRLAWRTGAGAIAASVFALLAVALAYFFSDARNRAERNLTAAERNLKAAKQAIGGLDTFIWNANQGEQIIVGAKLAEVQKSLGQIQTTLENLSETATDDLDLLALRVDNSVNFVDAYLTAHSLKNAEAAAKEAKATAKRMATLSASDPRSLTANIKAAYKTADVRKEALNLPDAIMECSEADLLAKKLVALWPSNGSALRLQWAATDKLGEALLASRDPNARSMLAKATGLARNILNVDTDPEHRREHLRDLAISVANEGRAAMSAGEYPTAISYFLEALNISRNLSKEKPADPLFPRDETLALMSLGGAKALNGDQSGAERDLGEAVAIARRLASTDQLDARSKHDLLAALEARAQIELETDNASARADLSEAVKIGRDFLESDRHSARSRFDLATVLMQLALNFSEARGDAEEVTKIVGSLRDDDLLTPADQATFAQFEHLMRVQ